MIPSLLATAPRKLRAEWHKRAPAYTVVEWPDHGLVWSIGPAPERLGAVVLMRRETTGDAGSIAHQTADVAGTWADVAR